MDRKKAKAYLSRKGVPQTKENVEEVMKEGKIYGDPIAMVE